MCVPCCPCKFSCFKSLVLYQDFSIVLCVSLGLKTVDPFCRYLVLFCCTMFFSINIICCMLLCVIWVQFHHGDLLLYDLDSPSSLFSLLPGHQTSPAVLNLGGWPSQDKKGQVSQHLWKRFKLVSVTRCVAVSPLTSFSLLLEVPFHPVAFVLGLNPCCCNRNSFTPIDELLKSTLAPQTVLHNTVSPSLCLQTWKASSVANRVLGWRMKIFVLEGKTVRQSALYFHPT